MIALGVEELGEELEMGEARVILFAKCKLADSFRTLLRWLGTRSTLVPFGLRCTASAIFRKEREKPEMWKVVHVSTYLALLQRQRSLLRNILPTSVSI